MSYELLANLVKEGKLCIIYIDSIPRSASTALEISLTHGAHGQVNEPFSNHKNCGEAYKIIFEYVKMLMEKNVGHNQEINLIVKEMAFSLPEDDWKQWVKIVSKFIFIMREPHLQIYSFLRERVRGTCHNPTNEQILKHGVDIDIALAQQKYMPLSWLHLKKHIAILEENLRVDPLKRMVIVEGTLLSTKPYNIIRKITDKLGINFCANMITGWTKATKDKFYDPGNMKEKGAKNSWYDKAINSTCFKLPITKIVPLDKFPGGIQKYITNVALPIYIELLRSCFFCGPETLDEIESIIDIKVAKDLTFGQLYPVTGYALACKLSNSELTHVHRQYKKNRNTIQINWKHKYHASFEIVSNICSASFK